MIDQAYPRLIPIQAPRGGGKTFLARAWAKQTVSTGLVDKVIIADRTYFGAMRFLEGLMETAQHWHRAKRTAFAPLAPQRDEFRLRGTRYGAAVCENIDTWPLVPAGDAPVSISVLMEEILAYTHGPVLCTFTDRVGLAALMFPEPVPLQPANDVPLADALETLEAA